MLLRLLALLSLALISYSLSAQKYLEMIEAGTFTLSEIQQEAEAHFDLVGKERGKGYKPYKRWEYVAQMELDETGVKIHNLELAKRARDYRFAEKQRQQTESSSFAGGWQQLGPTYWNATSSWNPGVGRITSIGMDASNNNHLIVGSPTGGVWKTLDGCNTWTNITDEFSNVDVYGLEISPYNSNLYIWGSTSGKIFRSTNAGASWNVTGNVSGSGRVSRVQFHPTNPNVVYAVSESNGLFVSINSGSTWSAVPGASGVPGYDVEFKSGDPNTIYFSGISVYRSTNGGNSFSQIGGFGTANNNYKRMSVSPANPNIVYVLESNGGRFGGFYKSTDSGGSFNKLIDGTEINYFGYSETGDDDSGQAPRNMDIAVSLTDAEEVHIGGIHTWKSIDGGEFFFLTSYWTPGTAASLGVGYNHADINVLKFRGSTLFVGTDGGLYTSTDGAASFVDRTAGLGIREFYKIGVSKTNPNVVSGGSQDNGTSVMRGANRAWVDWLGADGMETFVSWNNANNLYGTSQNGSMYRSTNQGTTRSSISKPPDVDDGAWVTPFEQDPQISNTIYVAFADVWKTSNNGSVWTKISDFANGNMNHMKLAPSSNQRIYVARGASLFTTANGGVAWTTITSGWGSSNISYIAIHPQNPQRLLIVTSSGVYHSTNAGTSWTNISTGLPSGAKYCATWENTGKNGIYVGGFGFVSYTNDDLAGQWIGFFDGLPNARVYELEINYISNTIFAGTYGRGLWESPIYQPFAPLAAFTADKRQGCRAMTVTFTDQSANLPTAWEWTFEGGTPATSTLQNPTVTFSGSGAYTVKLKSSNAVGDNTLEEIDYLHLFDPSVPTITNVARCDPGELGLEAIGQPGDQINWYATASETQPLFIGNVFTTNIAQTSTFYTTASTDYLATARVGPVSNVIGGGGDHAGDQYLILDATKPFRLKSAKVYANGAANRIFRMQDANGNVLLEKTVYVNDGENRITLDIDIPQGINLQIGCIGPANLYRNNTGPSYPYSIPGLMQIKSSTAGVDYYYYLYDIEVETTERCESDRVAVTGTVNLTPTAPSLATSGPAALCPGESVLLTAENVCQNCVVNWSNGENGPSITVSSVGSFWASVSNPLNTCGNGPSSDTIMVSEHTIPSAPALAASGSTALCSGESVLITAENLCQNCTVLWSNGESGPSISVSTEGIYTAIQSNICGDSPDAVEIPVTVGFAPDAPNIAASAPTLFCSGESIVLTATDVCPDCTLHWSNGETGPSITVSSEGLYTATLGNTCGESPASNVIPVTVGNVPAMPLVSVSGPTVLCPGESVVLTVTEVCSDCTVQWSTGEIGPSVNIATDGLYTAILSNTCGESPSSNPIAVATGTLPSASSISASGATALCPNESVVLTADNVCLGCIVQWSSGETGAGITVSSEGIYTATVSNVCDESPASNAITVTMGTLPGTPSISATGSTILCPNESVVLAVENVCSGCIVNWSNGETGESITVSTAGMYTASLSNPCGESPASNGIPVTVGLAPATPNVTASGTTALCSGASVVLTIDNVCADCSTHWSNGETGSSITVTTEGAFTAIQSNICGESPVSNAITVTVHPPFVPALQVSNLCDLTAPAGSNYQWFLNGVLIPDASGQFWSAEIAGNYVVSMKDPTGCVGTSEPIFAEACISNTFNVSGALSVRVYPNPAQDRVFLDIQLKQTTNAQLDLYATDGRFVGRLFQGEILPGGQILDLKLPDLPAGVYQYRMVTEMGSLIGNLVVQRR